MTSNCAFISLRPQTSRDDPALSFSHLAASRMRLAFLSSPIFCHLKVMHLLLHHTGSPGRSSVQMVSGQCDSQHWHQSDSYGIRTDSGVTFPFSYYLFFRRNTLSYIPQVRSRCPGNHIRNLQRPGLFKVVVRQCFLHQKSGFIGCQHSCIRHCIILIDFGVRVLFSKAGKTLWLRGLQLYRSIS